MAKVWTVYKYCLPNDKVYIGATCQQLSARQGARFQKYQGNTTLWNDIQKYGVDSIEQTILYKTESEIEAAEKEKEYISLYRSNDPERGYNVYPGGEGVANRHISEERKSILRSQMNELKARRIGTHPSMETRQKQRLAKLGKKRGATSDATKAKISKANSRENMSIETGIRRKLSKMKCVCAVNNETGEELNFYSLESCGEHFGVKGHSVGRWISGERKPHNGYSFKYADPLTTTERERLFERMVCNSLNTGNTAIMEPVRRGQR